MYYRSYQDDCKVLTGPNCLNQDYQDERMLGIEITHPGNPENRQILIQIILCRRPSSPLDHPENNLPESNRMFRAVTPHYPYEDCPL